MTQATDDPQPDYNAALHRAATAAAQHDLGTMLAELVACRCLDALHRYIQRLYPKLRDDEVDSIVGQVVDEFVVKAATSTILDPGAYLFTTARWRGLTLVEKRRQEILLDEGGWDQIAEENVIDRDEENDPERARQLYDAVYRLIPSIGTSSMQAVVKFVVEAAEQDQQVTHSEIAEALGMNPNSVSQQLRRGLERLRRRMLDDGLVPDRFTFPPTTNQVDQPDDQAEEAINYAD